MLWAALNGALALLAHPIRRSLVATDPESLYHTMLEVCLKGLESVTGRGAPPWAPERDRWAMPLPRNNREDTFTPTKGDLEYERSRHRQPVRTANGSFGGAFKTVPAYDLAKIVMQRVIADTGIDPGQLDEVIFGNIGQPSEAANIARVCALYAGVPEHVPAYTVQRNCASCIQAIATAYQAIQAGDGELFLVGGTENMSQIPYVIKGARWGLKLRHAELTDGLWEGLTDPTCNLIMGATAENLAEKYGISREEQDKYAVQQPQEGVHGHPHGQIQGRDRAGGGGEEGGRPGSGQRERSPRTRASTPA